MRISDIFVLSIPVKTYGRGLDILAEW